MKQFQMFFAILNTFLLCSFKIDQCQRLWIVDTGKIGLSPSPQLCPPKILVFDLKTNQLMHRYIIPMNQYNCNSLFINPVSSGALAEMNDKQKHTTINLLFPLVTKS